ncbi:SHOCT domain-containing protein [Yinghuangia sp. YIM S09857]|uniref:SHOCT domain-containing protein n=1 Tax=Yinghuangia sp. YIM S09857 TaxID=3436929 RepID=UPI003F529445
MDDYPLLNLFWTMLIFFLWIMWFFLLFRIVSDIFRSDDLGGWGKAAWIIGVIVLPFAGVLAYVIVRGRGMGERDAAQAKRADAAMQEYIRQAAGSDSRPTVTWSADELSKLAELRANGTLSEEEFQAAKTKLLA